MKVFYAIKAEMILWWTLCFYFFFILYIEKEFDKKY